MRIDDDLKGPIQSVEVSYLVHATEDPEKLGEAVRRVLGVSSPPETEELEGHFGNKIVNTRHHLTGDSASSTLSSLVGSLSAEARSEVLRNLRLMMDEHGALYLRLDKQSFFAGKLALAQGNVVRVRVKPRLFKVRGGVEEFFRDVLGAGK